MSVLNSFSTMFNQLPCFGDRTNSNRRANDRANAGSYISYNAPQCACSNCLRPRSPSPRQDNFLPEPLASPAPNQSSSSASEQKLFAKEMRQRIQKIKKQCNPNFLELQSTRDSQRSRRMRCPVGILAAGVDRHDPESTRRMR